MSTYLKPLRRKFGVATLVIACLFACGWARSYSTFNFTRLLVPGKQWALTAMSESGCIEFRLDDHYQHHIFGFSSKDITESGCWWCPEANTFSFERYLHFDHEVGTWECSFFLEFPYWSIVLPITLLSAWLLLSKPRVAKPTPIAEPVPEKVPCIMSSYFKPLRRKIGVVTLGLALVAMAVWGAIHFAKWGYAVNYSYGWSHCCDKVLALALQNFASAHGGAFPSGEAIH